MRSALIATVVLSFSLLAHARSAKQKKMNEWVFYSRGEKILVYEEHLPTDQRSHVVMFRGAPIYREEDLITFPYVKGFYRSSDFKEVPEEISYLVLNSYAGDGCPSKYTVIKFTATKQVVFEDIGNCDPVENIELGAKGLKLSFKNNPLIPERKAESRIF